MNISNSTKKRLLTVLLVTVLILAGISTLELSVAKNYELTYQWIEGEYTLPCSAEEPDGNIAHYYGSGDIRFRYAHDEYGYILMQNSKGYMVYAQNQGGRPVPGKVRYGADKKSIALAAKMSYADIDFAANPDLISDWEGIDYSEGGILNSELSVTLVNIIIFIEYQNTTFNVPEDNFASLLTADDNSLRDYYYNITYGNLDFESAYPKNGDNIYVYKAPQNRSYYDIADGTTRREREAKLLTNAVNAVNSKIDITGLNLDTNGDNRIDAVTFIMQGSASSSWGSLLWPHAWDLYYANQAYNGGASAKIGGIEVGKYNMQFQTSINQGVLCHEMSHVLGAPDLYHYNDSESYAPVGKWDLMQSNLPTPQYMTTHIRQKYIGYIAEEQIDEIEYNGIYSLKPTVSATSSDVLAYKIYTEYSDIEYFMVEYRNNSIATYDSMLPGSGLIVYRINITAQEGNKNAKYRDPAHPDEVYVFRPSVALSGSIGERSKINLDYANLAPHNAFFTSVGKSLDYSGSDYDNQTIYFSDGSNSGIIIEVLSMNEQALEFNVRLSGEDTIDNTYFQERISMNNAELVNNSNFSGVQANIHIEDIDITYLKSLRAELLDEQENILATNTLNLSAFYTSYLQGGEDFGLHFIVNDKDNIIPSVFDRGIYEDLSEPYYIRLIVEDADSDEIQLDVSEIDTLSCTWEEVLSTKKEVIPGLSASSAETVGLRFNGKVVSSGYYNYSGYSDIIAISSGFSHTLLLSKGLTVTAVSNDTHSKLDVLGWQDIVKISASQDNSYAIDLYGEAHAVGANDYGQLSIANYTNAKDIKGAVRHVVILGNDGRVYGAGDNTDGQLNFSNWTNIIAIDVGDTFTIGIREGGNVLVAGKVDGANVNLGWGDIVKVAAGSNYLLALNSSGKVLSYGNNQGGKASVADLCDIVDISAGVTHSAFLRTDGVVLYKGYNESATQAISNLLTDDYVSLTGITLNAYQKEIELSLTFKLEATVAPQDASYPALEYISLDESIATVDADGNITTLKEGSTTIRVKHKGSEVFADLALTVTNPILIESVSFDLAERNIVIGDSSFLNVVTVPAGATNRGRGVFSSGDTDIVEVNAATGEIIGKAIGTAIITVTIDDFGEEKSAQCTIYVIDKVCYIEILSHITKREYLYGEPLDLTGGIIHVVTVNEDEYELPITTDMVSGYDPYDTNSLGQQLTVTVDQQSVDFTVWVFDYAIGLEISKPIKTLYAYGEALDASDGEFVQLLASGAQSAPIYITVAMLSGYDPYEFGEQTITLTYQGLVATFTIFLTDPICQISPNFSKTRFAYGEQLPLGETFKITRLSGAEEYKYITYATLSGFDPYMLGTQSITLSYEGLQAYTIFQVEDYIDSIVIEGTKRQGRFMFYDNSCPLVEIGAFFELGGGPFGATLNSQDYLFAKYFYQGIELLQTDFTLDNLGDKPNLEIQLFVKRRTAGGVVSNLFLDSKSIELINIIEVDKIEIIYQSTYNRSEISCIADLGIMVEVTDINGNVTTEEPDSIDIDLSIFTFQAVQVTYISFSVTVQILLVNDPVSIDCEDSLQICYGAEFSGVVYLVKFNGDKQALSENDYDIFGFNSFVLGAQTVTLEYQTFSLQITVYIIEDINKLELLDAPEEYLLYEQIDLTGKTIKVTYTSGATREVIFDSNVFLIEPYNNNEIGVAEIVVKHIASGKTCSFEVTFNNYEVGIRVHEGSKSIYEYGEELALTAVYLIMADGSEITVTAYTTNYDKRNLGAQNVRVSYMGFTCLFPVTVIDVLEALELICPPSKISYSYGQAIALAGLELKATYRAVGEVIITEYSMLGVIYNPIKTGSQNVTLSLEAKSCSFSVTVRLKPSPLYNYSEEDACIYTNKVLFYQGLSVPDIFTKIALADYYSYLALSLEDSLGPIDIGSQEFIGVMLNGDYKLVVKNTDGQVVDSLNICIYGDMNNDGEFTKEDLQVLAEQFLKGAYREEIDFDNDGTYNLKDFVNWIKAANKKIDPQPLLLFFRSLVATPTRKYEL